jgi:hypothetical protein
MAKIPLRPCTSSMLTHHGYDAQSKTLALTFTGGKTHHYYGVSQAQYDAFTKAKSLGRHFGKHIRGKFKFT